MWKTGLIVKVYESGERARHENHAGLEQRAKSSDTKCSRDTSAPGSQRHRPCTQDLDFPFFLSQVRSELEGRQESKILKCQLSDKILLSQLCLLAVPELNSPLRSGLSPRDTAGPKHLSQAGRPRQERGCTAEENLLHLPIISLIWGRSNVRVAGGGQHQVCRKALPPAKVRRQQV